MFSSCPRIINSNEENITILILPSMLLTIYSVSVKGTKKTLLIVETITLNFNDSYFRYSFREGSNNNYSRDYLI
jgi:hypothetical protein